MKVSEVLITSVTNKVMSHIGASHSNNCQMIHKSFVHDIFCNNLQEKEIEANLEASEVLITYVTNRGKARAMLHIGAGHSNNCQIILKLFGYEIFCNNFQHKNNFKQIWRYQRY